MQKANFCCAQIVCEIDHHARQMLLLLLLSYELQLTKTTTIQMELMDSTTTVCLFVCLFTWPTLAAHPPTLSLLLSCLTTSQPTWLLAVANLARVTLCSICLFVYFSLNFFSLKTEQQRPHGSYLYIDTHNYHAERLHIMRR